MATYSSLSLSRQNILGFQSRFWFCVFCKFLGWFRICILIFCNSCSSLCWSFSTIRVHTDFVFSAYSWKKPLSQFFLDITGFFQWFLNMDLAKFYHLATVARFVVIKSLKSLCWDALWLEVHPGTASICDCNTFILFFLFWLQKYFMWLFWKIQYCIKKSTLNDFGVSTVIFRITIHLIRMNFGVLILSVLGIIANKFDFLLAFASTIILYISMNGKLIEEEGCCRFWVFCSYFVWVLICRWCVMKKKMGKRVKRKRERNWGTVERRWVRFSFFLII